VSTGANTTIDPDVRLSEVALLERDGTVRCIEHRARSFQGWKDDLLVERLRTQRYGVGGHYKHHFDWSGARKEQDRVSTFMVYVKVEGMTGGGTEFPKMRRRGGRWCEFVICEEKEREGLDMGLTFKPIAGNAIFWINLRPDGMGYLETWHAGLPVEIGEKIGLNIWSWGSARGLT
jgi:prolyl 4-hydroxylase